MAGSPKVDRLSRLTCHSPDRSRLRCGVQEATSNATKAEKKTMRLIFFKDNAFRREFRGAAGGASKKVQKYLENSKERDTFAIPKRRTR